MGCVRSVRRRPYNDNATIAAYNEALVPRLQAMGVQINDLFTPVSADIPRYIRADDLIHLTEEGIVLCTELVEKAIRVAANGSCETKVAHKTDNGVAVNGAPI